MRATKEKRVLIIVPFALDAEGIANRRRQLDEVDPIEGIVFDYRPVRAAPDLMDSAHDSAISELALFEAGATAESEGYDAVCVDTMSDSGVAALRSVLTIPVVGPGRASFLMALMLGSKFSVVTLWEAWNDTYRKLLREYGLVEKCASIRALASEYNPDFAQLLDGKEDSLFPQLATLCRQCVDLDGADVICLGSTTMHDAHEYLSRELDVPIINPGPLTYKVAEAALALGLTHSPRAHPPARRPKLAMVQAMLEAAERSENGAVA